MTDSDSALVSMPMEILLKIFEYLSPNALSSASRTCTLFKAITYTNSLWTRHCLEESLTAFWLTLDQRKLALKSDPLFHMRLYRWHRTSLRNLSGQSSTFSGRGTLQEPDGSRYSGDWVLGRKTGNGIHSWKDGSSFQGQWQNNHRDGYGVYAWSDGRRFDGTHENDKRLVGTFYWPEGSTYDGSYVASLRQGDGMFKWPSGDFYLGHWKRGSRCGNGIYFEKSSETVYLQVWDEPHFDLSARGDTISKLFTLVDSSGVSPSKHATSSRSVDQLVTNFVKTMVKVQQASAKSLPPVDIVDSTILAMRDVSDSSCNDSLVNKLDQLWLKLDQLVERAAALSLCDFRSAVVKRLLDAVELESSPTKRMRTSTADSSG